MKTIIHVHVQRMKQGLPSVIIKQKGKVKYFDRVDIYGPSVVISEPKRKRSPRAWIETSSEVQGMLNG